MVDSPRRFGRRAFLIALPVLAVGPGLFVGCRRAGDRHLALAFLVAELELQGGPRSLAEQSLAEVTAGDLPISRSRAGDGRAAGSSVRDRLARELLPGSGWRRGSAAVHRALEGQIQADYEVGRTVEISGWILSETEARLLAYSAIADFVSRDGT